MFILEHDRIRYSGSCRMFIISSVWKEHSRTMGPKKESGLRFRASKLVVGNQMENKMDKEMK